MFSLKVSLWDGESSLSRPTIVQYGRILSISNPVVSHTNWVSDQCEDGMLPGWPQRRRAEVR